MAAASAPTSGRVSGPTATLNVSLEDHLVDALRPLRALLPEALAAELSHVLDNASTPPSPPDLHAAPQEVVVSVSASPTRTIPYALLTAISHWSRSSPGQRALASHAPPLRVQDYSIVALLAGTRTSPERKFPRTSTPNHLLDLSSQSAQRRELGDRRAVTAVLNALLSVLGSGFATWWAADRLAWRNEWRVLLALSVAIVVASSEAVLYLIWEDRRSKKPTRSRRPLRVRDASVSADSVTRQADEKDDPDIAISPPPSDTLQSKSQETAVTSATSARVADNVLRERTLARHTRADHDMGQDQL